MGISERRMIVNNGKVVITNGTTTNRVQIFHWWPGREFQGVCPIPPLAIRVAEKRGSRYMTFAVADLPDGPIAAWAFCCPKDTPDRERGRNIALGRLAKQLEPLGWRMTA